MYFHTGIRRTELLLARQSTFPVVVSVLLLLLISRGNQYWEESQAHHSFPSTIAAPSPVPSLPCLDALMPNCLHHCPGLWQLPLSAEPAVPW